MEGPRSYFLNHSLIPFSFNNYLESRFALPIRIIPTCSIFAQMRKYTYNFPQKE